MSELKTLIGDPVTTAGNHRCMLPDFPGGLFPPALESSCQSHPNQLPIHHSRGRERGAGGQRAQPDVLATRRSHAAGSGCGAIRAGGQGIGLT
jgi:hypothetical protein